MSTDWNWSGARWWQFDFHTHTPASPDYGKGPRQAETRMIAPRDWLLDYMRADIDCVAVTDHDSGEWIDKLQDALHALETEEPDGYRPLHLFPGVEISVHGGVHVLAIFDKETKTSDIARLLGAVEYYPNRRGESGTETRKPINEVVDAIKEANGIAIPAHADGPKGLLEELRNRGSTLREVLRNENIIAIELKDPNYSKPGLYQGEKVRWTEVLGSDSHHRESSTTGGSFPGSHYTWIKMDEPTLEGIRLALLDGNPTSVQRSDGTNENPNKRAGYVIESLRVNKSKYIGRSSSFECQWNPFLNAVIGGRGSGKSTLIEFMRLVMQKDGDVPETLRGDIERYSRIYGGRGDDGVLTEKTDIKLVYRKGEERFRLCWSSEEDVPYAEKQEQGEWQPYEGEVSGLFPVSIFSQKQIYTLAGDPQGLLGIIDNSSDMDSKAWQEEKAALERKYCELSREKRRIDEELSQETRLRGELDETRRHLRQIEKSDYSELLRLYQRRRDQVEETQTLQREWEEMAAGIQKNIGEVGPVEINEDLFDPQDETEAACMQALREINHCWSSVKEKLGLAREEARKALSRWEQTKKNAPWMMRMEQDIVRYKEKKEELRERGIDPARYSVLVGNRRKLEERLTEIARLKGSDSVQKGLDKCMEKMLTHRRRLTRKRSSFVKDVLSENQHVQMEVREMAAPDAEVEQAIRELLQCDDKTFLQDIGGLVRIITAPDDNMEQKISRLKKEVHAILRNEGYVAGKRFRAHLQRLAPEQLDRLQCWFPEDALEVTFGPDKRNIAEGSPGQKNAALLAFLLSHGEGPLLLDQPEDDLDNELVYGLVVQQLRQIKTRRQVIVVTHNANIVVNGDAELVVALEPKNGETHMGCCSGLQDRNVRKKVCDIMEGGKEAFEKRYRKIHIDEK